MIGYWEKGIQRRILDEKEPDDEEQKNFDGMPLLSLHLMRGFSILHVFNGVPGRAWIFK